MKIRMRIIKRVCMLERGKEGRKEGKEGCKSW